MNKNYHLKFLLLVLLFSFVKAEDDYSARIAYGKVTVSDFSEIFMGNIISTELDYNVYALDGGYLWKKNLFDLPLDLYTKFGLAYYKQHRLKDVYEGVLYLKLYYNMDFLDNRVRIGFGDGFSYTSDYLEPEDDEAILDGDNHSKILNYIDFSVDIDVGKLIQVESLHGLYLGWAVKHRSGIFGLVNDVEEGGANYNTIYLEKKF